uniref:Uncharacterized protein n=1 Tax=Caenorhabditis japonica TaxID=281687 RepID=A0A8R1HKS4_CAEJA
MTVREKCDESNTTICSSVHAESCPSDPEETIIRNIKLPGFRGNISRALSQNQSQKSNSPSAFRKPTPRKAPPTYEQFQVLRRNSIKSASTSRADLSRNEAPQTPTPSRSNTITINGAHVQQAMNRIDMSTDSANTILRSPYSTRSDSITSVDSGQCSGDQIERRSLCSGRQESREEDDPSYTRMASTMDHVLRTSSALHTLLSAPLDANICRDLVAKSSVFLQLLESSPCANVLPKTEIGRLKMNVDELQKNREKEKLDMNNMTNFFAILLRKTIESVLLVFVRIISKYLSEEQIVTAFSRLAAHHLEQKMVQENAIPVLLEFLSLTHPVHADYCKRIRYKAAVCIGTLANTDVGMKALYDNKAYAILSNVLYDDNNSSNPFNMICNNIRTKLESKYQSESAV